MNASELAEIEKHLTPSERDELNALLEQDARVALWRPASPPQAMAYNSKADVIGYGGAAGSGKTSLAIGKALMQHHRVMVLRRESTQLQGILDYLRSVLGTDDGYNSQRGVWRGAGPRGVQIEFGSTPHLGDEAKYQGRDHDLLVFDEAANFLEQQVRFLFGWVRSTIPGMHSQALLLFNPPTNVEGRWIIKFFAPWLDRTHPLFPTPSGQLRMVAMVPGEDGQSKDMWVDRPDPFVIVEGQRVYDFNPKEHRPEDIVKPQSRTFIAARISDNPFLINSGYLRQLQAMPEPLRSQMLYGDFTAGIEDDPWQLLPTKWCEAAMARWKPRTPRGEMLSVGVDVARGGKDNSCFATRHHTGEHAYWFDKVTTVPGTETPDGPKVAGLVMAMMRDRAPIHIDVIGVGASPYDVLVHARMPVLGVNVAEKATDTDLSGRLSFVNLRSQLWWKFRELLDPANDTGIALPNDPDLLAELCAPKWTVSGMRIQVQSREEIVQLTGRSPDRATAIILASIETPKFHEMQNVGTSRRQVIDNDPYNAPSTVVEHNPYD